MGRPREVAVSHRGEEVANDGRVLGQHRSHNHMPRTRHGHPTNAGEAGCIITDRFASAWWLVVNGVVQFLLMMH